MRRRQRASAYQRNGELGGNPLGLERAELARDRLLEDRVLRLLEHGIVTKRFQRPASRALEQLLILGQPGDLELGKPGLLRPEQVALSSKREIDLGQLEAVALPAQRFEAPAREIRRIGCEEKAVRLVLPPPDAATQL